MTTDTVRPLSMDLDRKTALRIRWADGHECNLPLDLLRRSCPCATCRQEREERAKNPLHVMRAPADDAEHAWAEGAELVGNYALRIRWHGGHDTGIYEYSMLRSLCACARSIGS